MIDRILPWVVVIMLVAYIVYSWGRGDAEARRLKAVADSARAVAERVQEENAQKDAVIQGQQVAILAAWDSVKAVNSTLRNITPPEALERSVSDEDVAAALDTADISEGIRALIQGLEEDNRRMVMAYDTLYAAYRDLERRNVDLTAAADQAIQELTATYEERLALERETNRNLRLALDASNEALDHVSSKWWPRLQGAVVGGLVAAAVVR